jgi:hypothetical protein
MFGKLNRLEPGEDPQYASSYESHGPLPMGVTEYYGPNGWDIEKSKQLADLRKTYGLVVENKIAEIWQRANAQEKHYSIATPYTGTTTMSQAQDYFLTHEAPLLLRDAHQKAKNPMLY